MRKHTLLPLDDCYTVQTAQGKPGLFVAFERTPKLAYAELHQKAGKMVAARFLRNLIAALPLSSTPC